MTQPEIEPGRTYRTRDLSVWAVGSTRLAKQLVKSGALVELGKGFYACPTKSKFGAVLPADEELMRGFLDGAPYLFTGPERWNALGLGSTALFAARVVYNTKRSGSFTFGGRRFNLSRTRFPADPPPEWFVIDLLENSRKAGVSRDRLFASLGHALADRKFDRKRLLAMAQAFGTQGTRKRVRALTEGE